MPENKTSHFSLDKFLKKILVLIIQLIGQIRRIFTEKDYFNNHHLEITTKDGFRLSVKWYKHDEYITYKEESLKLIKDELDDPVEWIEYSLLECSNCAFIIFDCGNEKRFIQFWLGDGKLMADWPVMKKGNDLKKFTYAMLGVLNSLDIHRVDSSAPKKPRNLPYFKHNISDKSESYSIYFQKYPQDAVQFTKIMLRDVFKGKLNNLNIKLG